MVRLPQPGSDKGTWGDILNDFLSMAHNADGTLKAVASSNITGLSAVAISGNYSDLANRPTIPASAAAPTGNPTTDTATVSAAKAAGQRLQLGTYVINPIVIQTGDELIGSGWGTILQLANGASAHMVTMDPQAQQWTIADIKFNGNKANQTAGDGLHFDTSSYTAGNATPNDVQDDDPNPEIRRVAIFDCYGNGFYIKGGRGAGMFHQMYSADNGGCGFDIESPDNEFLECTAGSNGNQGFLVAPSGGNVRLMNCKSFLSGRWGASTLGAGFDIQNVGRVDAVDCSAQDNRGHGFSVTGTNQFAISGISEGNGRGLPPETAGGHGDGIYVSGSINGSIRLVCGDRQVSGFAVQRYGYNFAGSGNYGIIADVVIDSVTQSGVAGNGTLGSGSILRGTYQSASFGNGSPAALSSVVTKPKFSSGYWYTTEGAAQGNQTPTIAREYAHPYVVQSAVTLNTIGCYINTAQAGCTGRLGIRNDNNGIPGSLISGTDVASLDFSTVGAKQNTISVTLQPGLYWLCSAMFGTTAATWIGINGYLPGVPMSHTTTTMDAGLNRNCWGMDGSLSTGLYGTFTTTGVYGEGARVGVKVA